VRVGLLWRAEWDPVDPDKPVRENSRLRRVFESLEGLGVETEPVAYSDDAVDEVRDQLRGLDGVLVWVNPIQDGLDRSKLDPLLLEAAEAGVWVSAHPDVILRMGTKQVLVETREMSWGTDSHVYRTLREFRNELPDRLAAGEAKVLKQYRGMGGNGVWKVELAGEAIVQVQHAQGGSAPERMTLSDFFSRCQPYFAGAGRMIEQPFQDRLEDGMIRIYLTHDKVVGFAHQHPRGLLSPLPEGTPAPAPTQFQGATAPEFQHLRKRAEREWVPELQRIVGVETIALPVIWDIDLLFGPKTAEGEDSYILCEINVSSTFAFPEQALGAVATATITRVREHGRKTAGRS
jgi:hypothetical protein